MSADNGGPAFPQDNDATGSAGMTLRDYFAAKAMHGILAGDHPITHDTDCAEKTSRAAYEFANAMLAERAK